LSKIREIEYIMGAGARTNKYRVLIPFGGREIDIQCHDVNAPGRSMGVAEVFLKGRKYQLAGDRADEGSLTLTFYNDPELILRTTLLDMVNDIQDYNVPGSSGGGGYGGGGSPLPYQTDVTIEQLDHEERVVIATVYHSAFVTEVGAIDYQDEIGEISTTALTLSYTGSTII